MRVNTVYGYQSCIDQLLREYPSIGWTRHMINYTIFNLLTGASPDDGLQAILAIIALTGLLYNCFRTRRIIRTMH